MKIMVNWIKISKTELQMKLHILRLSKRKLESRNIPTKQPIIKLIYDKQLNDKPFRDKSWEDKYCYFKLKYNFVGEDDKYWINENILEIIENDQKNNS